MITIKVTTKPEVTSTFPKFARIKHWHERYFDKSGRGLSYIAAMRQISGNPRLYAGAHGDPAVFQLNQSSADKAVFLTPALEWWIKGLLIESSKGSLPDKTIIEAYKNEMQGAKAFTNKTGWSNGKQSVVLNMNIGAEPQRLQLTIANGATVKVLGDKTRRGGEWVYPIEVMNAQDPNTLKRTLKDSWWLMFPATNSTIDPVPEGMVTPFPYMSDFDVIVPLLANNTTIGYVEAEWVEFVGNITQPIFPYYRCWVTESMWKRNRGLI